MGIDAAAEEGLAGRGGFVMSFVRRARSAQWPLSLASTMVASTLSLWPVLSEVGWPRNHESMVWATRAAVLRAAWQRGDWMPLWWSEGNRGFGSPMPALYHKLQNYICTLIFQVLDDFKSSLVLSLLLFSVIGSLGVRRLALDLGVRPLAATLLGLALPFTDYATADWLVRGAFAEHAAFMLLPWLLVVLLGMIRTGQVPILRLSGALFILFLTHSLLALYASGLIAIAALATVASHPALAGRLVRDAGLAAVVFLIGVAPQLWVTQVMVKPINFAYTTQNYYQVHRHLTTLVNALFLGRAPVVGFSVALDPVLWAALGAAAALPLYPRFRSRRPLSWWDASLAFLLVGSVVMFFLRLEWARPVYEHVPGLRYIQFPWRLLAFANVLVFGVIAWLLARLRGGWALGVTVLLLGGLMATNRVFRFHEDVWFSPEQMTVALDPSVHIMWWEYVPAVPGPANAGQLKSWSSGPRAVTDGCQVTIGDCSHCFVADCTAPGTIALPYAQSGMEWVTDGAGRGLHAYRTPGDARVRVDVPAARTAVEYHAPSWGSAFRRLVSGSEAQAAP